MGTASTSLTPDNTSDATFRAWASGISTQLAAMGLTKTGDTGQINLTTVTHPTVANTAQGYEIWQFNDTLQATAPFFLKIEYGASSSGATIPGVWLTVGTVTDGAGNLTGLSTSARTSIFGQAASAGTSQRCAFSGSTNRFTAALFYTLASGWFWFSLERTKDNSGADTNTGMVMIYGATSTTRGQVVVPQGAAPPTAETDYGFLMSTSLTGIRGTTIALFQNVPFLGQQLNPMLTAFSFFNNEVTAEVSFTASVYGSTHTFFPIGNQITSVGRGSIGTSRLAILWE